MARMVAPPPSGLSVPQATALSGTALLSLMVLVGFLEKPPTVLVGLVSLAFLALSVASGWWPVPAGVAIGALLTASIAFPHEDSFALFACLIPITVLGMADQPRARRLLGAWYLTTLATLTTLRPGGTGELTESLSTVLFVVVVMAGAWLLGTVLHGLETRREHTRRAAVRRVRLSVAQDLHDTMAHSLSLIAIRADQARQAGHGTATDLQFIADHSRQAIQDLRGILAMLREDSRSEADVSSWTVDPFPLVLEKDVSALRRAGFDVTTSVEGDPGSLPRTADGTLAKVLHEALANVQRHAEPGSHCTVMVTIGPASAELAVVSAVPRTPLHRSSDSLGLLGMGERIEGAGGDLEVGRMGDRWVVQVSLPLLPATAPRLGGVP